MMQTVTPQSRVVSASWSSTSPDVSVVVATHDRARFLTGLHQALVDQTTSTSFEVVIADDGSTDGTWSTLQQLIATSPLAMMALRLRPTGGPSLPRNTAVAHARGRTLALTDDDCLPEPGWLDALLPRAATAAIVQGRTIPVEGHGTGSWDRSIWVQAPSGLWETCNLAIRRELFVELGGFRQLPLLARAPRGFGEDVVLGARAARHGGWSWVPEATVRHRWLPGSFRDQVEGMRRLAGFPLLLHEVPELRGQFWHHWFLTRRTAAADLGGISLLASVASRRVWPLAGVLPWLVQAVPAAHRRRGRPLAWRLAQGAVLDAVAVVSLARGSLRARRWVL